MQEIKYAVHIKEGSDRDYDMFERGQSYGLFDSFDEAEEYFNLNFSGVDFLIYPLAIVDWD